MDNVIYLSCPQNNMKLSLEDLCKRVEQGKVRSLVIAAEIDAGEETAIHSGYVVEDTAEMFRLTGALFSLMRRIDLDHENRYLDSMEQKNQQ